MVEKIDQALIDRTDLMIEIPLPSVHVLIKIMTKCVDELVRKNILVFDPGFGNENGLTKLQTEKLQEISAKANNSKISGRSIKQLPILACLGEFDIPFKIDKFLTNLEKQVDLFKM